MIRSLIARVLAVALLGVGVPLAVTASPASAAGEQWVDGAFANSQVINCPSMIFGSPLTEFGIMSYVGYYGDPQPANNVPNPAVGETFTVHLVVGGVGNTCAGQYAQPAIVLPAGLSVVGGPRCWATLNSNPPGLQACTQQQQADGRILFRYDEGGQPNSIWPVPQGSTWEFQLDVKATSQLVGQLRGVVGVADGNSNPTLNPTAGVYVLPSTSSGVVTPEFAYPSPSTERTPGNPPTHISTGFVTTPKSGTAKFQVKSGGSFVDVPGGSVFLNQAATWVIKLQWDTTVQGFTWNWRMCFTPTGGSTTCGAQQTFTGLSSDSTAPTLTSIALVNNAHAGTPGDRVTSPKFTVRMTFSEPVTGVEGALFASSSGLTLPNPDAVVVSPNNTAGVTYSSTYTVTLNSGLGSGKRATGLFGAGFLVTDRAGNGLAVGGSVDVWVNRPTADIAKPTITTAVPPVVTLTPTFRQSWTSSDPGSGLGFFTVQSLVNSLAGAVGPFDTPGTVVAPGQRFANVAIAQGTTRCVRVTATDASGNSQAGTVRCSAKPVDDRGTSATGSWTNVAATTAFRGTLVRSSSAGATRFLTGVKAKRIIVVAEKRPGAGTVEVLVNGAVKGTFSLAASSVRPKQTIVVTLPSAVSGARIAVRVKTTGSSGVRIDGLGASAT